MVFVPAPLVAEVDVITTQFGSRMSNTLYFLGSPEWTSTTLTNLAIAVHTWWHTRARAFMSTTVEIAQIDARALVTQNAVGISYFPTANTGGSVASPGLPNNVTLSITFRTALRGRSYRGRNYVVGLPESLVTGDQVASATVAGIVTAYQGLNTDVAGVNAAVHAVLSRYTGNAPRLLAVATPVTAYASDGVVDSQRRRLLGRGQ